MITKNFFGETSDGRRVDIYELKNSNETAVDIITYGATVNNIFTKDKNGVSGDILVGFDDVEGNEKRSSSHGVTVGRYANRIENGEFTIDDVKYEVYKNEKGITCVHGGDELSKAVWNAIIVDDNCLEMSYTSPDGSMGFPGRVEFKVTFTLYENDSLKIDYYAVSDKKTVINMTNHSYFNLSGGENVLSTELMINADAYTPTDERSIPTGEIRPVEETAFDFRAAKPIGRDIGADDEQLIMCRGYDHNFCLNEGDGPAATAYDPESGRMLEVYTDLLGLQLYTGNFLDGTVVGKGGKPMQKHAGFCLETQFYPNTPNMPEWPQCTFDAGEKFTSTTVFKFSVK